MFLAKLYTNLTFYSRPISRISSTLNPVHDATVSAGTPAARDFCAVSNSFSLIPSAFPSDLPFASPLDIPSAKPSL